MVNYFTRVTHQDIVDRIAAMDEERDRLARRHAKERESLAEMCGGLGHQWGESNAFTSCTFLGDNRFAWRFGRRRVCRICEQHEDVLDAPAGAAE